MNPRKAIEFFKTPTGSFVALVILLLAVAFFMATGKSKPIRPINTNVEKKNNNEGTFFKADIPTIRKIVTPAAPKEEPKEEPKPVVKQTPPPVPMDIYTSDTPSFSKNYAPFGRLMKCELVMTVDSSRIQTPIIGLVTEDIHGPTGRLVVPAGAEIHGTARNDRSRERIASDNNWVLVFHDGRELSLKGIALDQSPERFGNGWNITDGSAGLRGEVIKTDDMAELKLLAAKFIQGFAGGFEDSENVQNGGGQSTIVRNGSLQNALSGSFSEAANIYAQTIMDKVKADGFFVRVAAGSTFYVYVEQPIDQARARIAGSKLDQKTQQKFSNRDNQNQNRE